MTKEPMRLYNLVSDTIEPNSKIVVFYNDGSGCKIMRKTNELFDDCQEPTTQECLFERGFLQYAYIPDDFELWEVS
jgi:hypothetical protein